MSVSRNSGEVKSNDNQDKSNTQLIDTTPVKTDIGNDSYESFD